MEENDIIRLDHMLEAAREIRLFTRGKTKDDLEKDRILTLALIKEMEIIGEAASQVSQEARDQIPGIPWQKIIGMRNRLIHVYFEIDEDILRDTILYDIPRLIEELEAIAELR